MFDYVQNEYNPEPRFTVAHPPATSGLVRYLPYSEAIVVDVPNTSEELAERQDARYWAEIRRRERRFTDAFGPLSVRGVTDPTELADLLPQVQALYAERWSGEYTSLPWKRPAGFAPYADALIDLASKGRGELAVAEGDGRLLAFSYCLYERPWAYMYQHAATPQERYRRFGPGKLLLVDLLRRLVADGGFEHLDLMLGDAAYKREWESWRRDVHVAIHAPDTVIGRARLWTRTMAHQARSEVQFGHPWLRRGAKRALAGAESLTNVVRR